jgi:hypothetical protein
LRELAAAVPAPSQPPLTVDALPAAACSLAADGEPLILVTPSRSPLTALAGQRAVRLHLTQSDEAAASALRSALEQPGGRRHRRRRRPADRDAAGRRAGQRRPGHRGAGAGAARGGRTRRRN